MNYELENRRKAPNLAHGRQVYFSPIAKLNPVSPLAWW